MSSDTPQKPQLLTNNPIFFFLFSFVVVVVVSAKTQLISPSSTLHSPNGTFEFGYFSLDSGLNHYIGIWYASIPLRTYVWVANRDRPIKNVTDSTAEITPDGRLAVTQDGNSTVWITPNARPAARAALLETGNLVLFDKGGGIVWQSFDSPTDTWLPGMRVGAGTVIVCWRSSTDPAQGPYALRLSAPAYGGFELVHGLHERYWSTGSWRGSYFAGVPEMTVPYVYSFRFDHPFTSRASFLYDLAPPAGGLLTRFVVDPSGQLRQFAWSEQTQSWSMFWSRPESACRAYGLCGELGFCLSGTGQTPCGCLDGYAPSSPASWRAGDYSDGCRRTDNISCAEDDGFVDVGPMDVDGEATTVDASASGGNSRQSCEESCLKNCSCLGLSYDARTGECKTLFGKPSNLRNSTADRTDGSAFFIRVGKMGLAQQPKKRNSKGKEAVLIGGLAGSVLLLGVAVVALAAWKKQRQKKQKSIDASYGDDGSYSAMSLKVFSYKELQAATRGFSEKLGHGGFGAVFRGALPDSTPVAVKRLERPGGGGDREFRAEVCTIGSVQHVNLVRLRGFCSENSHRLLVYDYMENGPLSGFLRKDGGWRCLRWEERFRIAVGTARGIAYLHEECRDCIIHCDIKPENILLDGDMNPKVSDFGLAKLVGRDFSRVMTTMRGTWGYVAPEWISGVAITAKADVYSYGMTLLEIVGGRRNVDAGAGAGADEKWFFPPWAARQVIEGNVEAVVDGRLAGEYERGEAERAAMVAVWCIQDEEAERPTMGAVVKMLEGRVEVPVPPPPQLLQALCEGDSFPEGGIVSEQGMAAAASEEEEDKRSEVGSADSDAAVGI